MRRDTMREENCGCVVMDDRFLGRNETRRFHMDAGESEARWSMVQCRAEMYYCSGHGGKCTRTLVLSNSLLLVVWDSTCSKGLVVLHLYASHILRVAAASTTYLTDEV
jgi:hypothetical protein